MKTQKSEAHHDEKMNYGTPEKRKLMSRYYREVNEWSERRDAFMEKTGLLWNDFPEPSLDYPEEIRGMMCGAKNRKGTQCKQLSLYTNGRCKFHGGASTGPRTRKGKKKSAKNGFKVLAQQTP